jgi:hypothetical protein
LIKKEGKNKKGRKEKRDTLLAWSEAIDHASRIATGISIL